MIPLTPITGSSQLAAAGYDEAQRVLAVQFANSAFVYHYRDVEPEVGRGLDSAESKGKFFAQHVRGKYDFNRIDTAAQNKPEIEGSAAD